MNIGICDDKAFCRDKIQCLAERFLNSRGVEYSLHITCSEEELLNSGIEALDLLFLDVHVAGTDRFEAVRKLRLRNKNILIVYISAAEYDLQGYGLDAFSYLLKSDLEETFDRCMAAVLDKLSEGNETLTIILNGTPLHIALPDILYIEGNGRKVVIHRTNGVRMDVYRTMKEMETDLSPHSFLRIQKSYLVNMQYIRQISNYAVHLINDETLNASKDGYKAIKGRWLGYRENGYH